MTLKDILRKEKIAYKKRYEKRYGNWSDVGQFVAIEMKKKGCTWGKKKEKSNLVNDYGDEHEAMLIEIVRSYKPPKKRAKAKKKNLTTPIKPIPKVEELPKPVTSQLPDSKLVYKKTVLRKRKRKRVKL